MKKKPFQNRDLKVVTLNDFDDSPHGKDCYGDQLDHGTYVLYVGRPLHVVTVNECYHHYKIYTCTKLVKHV